MDSQESSGGGKTTLFIVVFFLCVISAVVGYFQFSLSSQRAEAEKELKELQQKTQADIAAAKSEEEKREIQRKADLEGERIKMKAQSDAEKATMKAQSDAEKKALSEREAKLKAAEAAVKKKLADAAKTVKNAKNLQNQAKKVKADADKKKKDADAAMAKAIATGKENDKKLANEKKKIAADANRKVKAANKKAADAKKKAQAEAKKALAYKKKLNEASKTIKKLSDVVGQYIYLEQPNTSEYINLSQIKVWTSNNKMVNIPGENVEAISIHSSGWKPENLVGSPFKQYHSKWNPTERDWVRVNLGKPTPITKIQIANRRDCCRGRINNITVQILDNKKEVVKTLPKLTGSSFMYTIDPNGSLGWVQT
jgi:myosin heavy subunit